MNIKAIAAILLIERIISAGFITVVLRRQISLFKLPIIKELRYFRVVLFLLSLIIFVGNFIPILIDTLTLFANLEGRPNPAPIGVAYAISNATTSIFAALFVWVMYQMAAATDTATAVKRLMRLNRKGMKTRKTDK